MRLKKIALLFLVVSLAACNESALIKKFAKREDVARAKHYIALLRGGKVGEVEGALDASVDRSGARAQLEEMANLFPARRPLSIKLVGAWDHFFFNSQARYRTNRLVFEYHYPDRWLVVTVIAKQQGGVSTLLGIGVQPNPGSLEEINRFTLSGKDFSDYFLLFSALGILLFTIYALVACIRTPIGHAKWFWIPFILIGFGSDVLNWTTGGVSLRLLMVRFPPAAFSHWQYAPWSFSLSLPLGALLFVFWRKGRSRPRRARVVIGEGVLGATSPATDSSVEAGRG